MTIDTALKIIEHKEEYSEAKFLLALGTIKKNLEHLNHIKDMFKEEMKDTYKLRPIIHSFKNQLKNFRYCFGGFALKNLITKIDEDDEYISYKVTFNDYSSYFKLRKTNNNGIPHDDVIYAINWWMEVKK